MLSAEVTTSKQLKYILKKLEWKILLYTIIINRDDNEEKTVEVSKLGS